MASAKPVPGGASADAVAAPGAAADKAVSLPRIEVRFQDVSYSVFQTKAQVSRSHSSRLFSPLWLRKRGSTRPARLLCTARTIDALRRLGLVRPWPSSLRQQPRAVLRRGQRGDRWR